MLGISVILDPHSQIISIAPLASTALKALNPQSHAALEASTLTLENGSQQTVTSAQLDTSAVVSLCWCIWELGIHTMWVKIDNHYSFISYKLVLSRYRKNQLVKCHT